MTRSLSRRQMLQHGGFAGLAAALQKLLPDYVLHAGVLPAIQTSPPALSGEVINLTIGETPIRIGSRQVMATTLNGTVPGPLIRLREGQQVTLNVTNRLSDMTSIHWHGVLVPHDMDGVPGVSFKGIEPGETFSYKFKVRQYGTYWYHSHSPGQLQLGTYAPLIIDHAKRDPVEYDREYTILLSDWSFQSEGAMLARLKKQAGYFNFQQRTMGEFFRDLREYGWAPTMDHYLMWSRMRMDPSDFADVTGFAYVYLMNGLTPEANWTALFTPKERVRLRFINAGAMTFHDVRIPDLQMSVVQADGQDVEPVAVDEFRIGPGETYDVVVVPPDDRAYTIFSEVLDRSGYARGTLAPRPGMMAEVPPRRRRPLRTMEEMGMRMGDEMPGMALEMDKNAKAGGKPMMGRDMMMPGMTMPEHDMKPGMKMPPAKPDAMPDMNMPRHEMKPKPAMPGQDMKQPGMTDMKMGGLQQEGMKMERPRPVSHGPDSHGTGNQMAPEETTSRFDDPGAGLGGDGRRVLTYADLMALEPGADHREPGRALEIHLTGHMERFMWSLDGRKFSDARQPIHFQLGERLRWTFVNDTMMEHTMHLHGMFMELENGAEPRLPRKHTVLVKPAERISVAITPDERGPFAFHCHLSLHMEAGMFRVVLVSDRLPETTR
ncbi:MAG: copper resistance system multicopper oxidase [Cyanobacteria bacterium]|nr:copper resistance system multicopper oxidase [Cyanobacteriota bacterium]